MRSIGLFMVMLLLIGSGFSLNAIELSVKEMEHMVEKIKQRRPGVNLEDLDAMKTPFVKKVQEQNETTGEVLPHAEKKNDLSVIEVSAIINKKAFVNGRWIKEGDKVQGFEVVHIGRKGIVIKNEEGVKTLFVASKREKINILQVKERKHK